MLFFQSSKNNHNFEQISNPKNYMSTTVTIFFVCLPWGKYYISDLEKKIGRSADKEGGGRGQLFIIFANLSQKTSDVPAETKSGCLDFSQFIDL